MRMHLFTKQELFELFEKNGFLPEWFDSVFILQKPRWCSMEKFSLLERIKLRLERILPKEYGCVYFAVFRRVW